MRIYSLFIFFICIPAIYIADDTSSSGLRFREKGPTLAARFNGMAVKNYTADYVYKMPFWKEFETLARTFSLDETSFPFSVDDKPRLKSYLNEISQADEFKSLKIPLQITDFFVVDTSDYKSASLKEATPYLKRKIQPIIMDFVAKNTSFVVKPSQGFRSHGVLIFKAEKERWSLFKLNDGEKRLMSIFPTNSIEMMFNLLINEMQRNLSYDDEGDAWRFPWDGTDYGYCNGFIFETYIPPLNKLVPEIRFAFLYGHIYVVSVYRSDDDMQMVYNRQTQTYTSVYGISLKTFIDLMEMAKTVARHFKFHWGRVDVFYDHIRNEFFVNEVQAKGTDDLFQCFTTPYAINFIDPCTSCMNRIMKYRHFWDFHTDYTEYNFKKFLGISPYTNNVNSQLWKNYTFESYMQKETREDLRKYCQWYDDNGYK